MLSKPWARDTGCHSSEAFGWGHGMHSATEKRAVAQISPTMRWAVVGGEGVKEKCFGGSWKDMVGTTGQGV